MSAIRIILQIGLLFGGAYLWMRHFSAPTRNAGRRPAAPILSRVLSGLGIVMMIVALSGISSAMLALLEIAPGGPGGLRGGGSGLALQIVLGSLFSAVGAGIACVLVRALLVRRERADGTHDGI